MIDPETGNTFLGKVSAGIDLGIQNRLIHHSGIASRSNGGKFLVGRFPILINDSRAWDLPDDVQLAKSEVSLKEQLEPLDLLDPKIHFLSSRGVRLEVERSGNDYLVVEKSERLSEAKFHEFLVEFARAAYGSDLESFSSSEIILELLRRQG